MVFVVVFCYLFQLKLNLTPITEFLRPLVSSSSDPVEDVDLQLATITPAKRPRGVDPDEQPISKRNRQTSTRQTSTNPFTNFQLFPKNVGPQMSDFMRLVPDLKPDAGFMENIHSGRDFIHKYATAIDPEAAYDFVQEYGDVAADLFAGDYWKAWFRIMELRKAKN